MKQVRLHNSNKGLAIIDILENKNRILIYTTLRKLNLMFPYRIYHRIVSCFPVSINEKSKYYKPLLRLIKRERKMNNEINKARN